MLSSVSRIGLRNVGGLISRNISIQVRRSLPQSRINPNVPLRFIRSPIRFLSTGAGQDNKNESTNGPQKVHEFKAETKKLLDIVAHSLYSEKEIFVRELISNASDALEKLRYTEATEKEREIVNKQLPSEIRIYTDASLKTLTIYDTGIGMSEQEAIQNLGTIAHSGSKAFLEKLGDLKEGGARENIIGQFGVGFYSAFMVGNRVKVYSKSAFGAEGIRWESDGAGHYEIHEDKSMKRGTKIVIELKDNCDKFADGKFIESIIKKYSNFIQFPIYVNDVKVNTMQPLWTLSKQQVTPEMHKQFYSFLTGDWEEPEYSLHYSVDSPIMIRAVLYAPKHNTEILGRKYETGVSVYSRKVLIKSNATDLLPNWLRFISGVCDSEDIPLNLSREMLQDSSVISKIRTTLTNRIISWFQSEASNDPKKFNEFFSKFQHFFEEGVLHSDEHRQKIAPLLRFNSSLLPEDETSTMDEYIKRMKADQKAIYYLIERSKKSILSSPYLEQFKTKGIEVLCLNNPLSDFALKTLGTYQGHELICGDSVDLDGEGEETKKKKKDMETSMADFTSWFMNTLKPKVSQIKISTRMVNHPALIVDRELAIQRQLFESLQNKKKVEAPNVLEINPEHPLIKKLNIVRKQDEKLGKMIAEQIYDNALFSAGLVPDYNDVVLRVNNLMELFMEKVTPTSQSEEKK